VIHLIRERPSETWSEDENILEPFPWFGFHPLTVVSLRYTDQISWLYG